RRNTSVLTSTCCASGAGGAASRGTAAGVACVGAADGMLTSVAACCCSCAAGSTTSDVRLGPNKDGLPLYACQLFHNSSSEKVRIIQRMVRRISMSPLQIEAGQICESVAELAGRCGEAAG